MIHSTTHFEDHATASRRSASRSDVDRMPRMLTGFRIAGTGAYLPERVIGNAEVSNKVDDQWIKKRTGIQSRYYAHPDQCSSDLAVESARRTLSSAQICRECVDLIIVATSTPDYQAPSTAAIVQGKLGCHNAAALDLNAGCSGFVHAFITACQFVASGCQKCVLVIGAETLSGFVDPRDQNVCPLFGDGAGSVLIVADERKNEMHGQQESFQGIQHYEMGAKGTDCQLITMGKTGSSVGEHFIQMDGKSVFKWAVSLVPDLITQVVQRSGLQLSAIDLFVVHQANIRIIEASRSKLGICSERFCINIERYGNTSAASIPIALSEAVSAGSITRNSRLVLCGFGAGLNWAACVVNGVL